VAQGPLSIFERAVVLQVRPQRPPHHLERNKALRDLQFPGDRTNPATGGSSSPSAAPPAPSVLRARRSGTSEHRATSRGSSFSTLRQSAAPVSERRLDDFPKAIPRLIAGSWLLSSPNACRSPMAPCNVSILRFKKLPPFRHDPGIQNHVCGVHQDWSRQLA
jgi:hypothetical protein